MKILLKSVLDEKEITQKELSVMCGVRESTISDICRNSRTCINKKHLTQIANALNITDISELITL